MCLVEPVTYDFLVAVYDADRELHSPALGAFVDHVLRPFPLGEPTSQDHIETFDKLADVAANGPRD